MYSPSNLVSPHECKWPYYTRFPLAVPVIPAIAKNTHLNTFSLEENPLHSVLYHHYIPTNQRQSSLDPTSRSSVAWNIQPLCERITIRAVVRPSGHHHHPPTPTLQTESGKQRLNTDAHFLMIIAWYEPITNSYTNYPVVVMRPPPPENPN